MVFVAGVWNLSRIGELVLPAARSASTSLLLASNLSISPTNKAAVTTFPSAADDSLFVSMSAERGEFWRTKFAMLMVCKTNTGWLFTHSSAFLICPTVVLATYASTSLFVNLLTARTDGLSFCFLLPPLPLELLLLLLLLPPPPFLSVRPAATDVL